MDIKTEKVVKKICEDCKGKWSYAESAYHVSNEEIEAYYERYKTVRCDNCGIVTMKSKRRKKITYKYNDD